MANTSQNQNNQNSGPMPSRTGIIKSVTANILNSINMANPPTPEYLEAKILEEVNTHLQTDNTFRNKGDKHRLLSQLLPGQLSAIILKMHHVVNISYNKTANPDVTSDYDLLGVYNETGINEGIYSTNDNAFARIIEQYSEYADKNTIEETISSLRRNAPHVAVSHDPDLVPVNNGIFNYKTKQLMPFDPAYIFTAKSHVSFNPNAQLKVFTNKDGSNWDVETWVQSLSDDPEVVDLLWKIVGASIRPNNSWDKAIWLYSTTGNNGKGTLCVLIRNLCGEGSHASVSISAMSKDFELESLIGATANIVDENDVGMFIDKAANFKAIITGDTFQINRKFRIPVTFRFKGLNIFCMNELPRVKDKSESFMRRLLIVPLMKCFTGEENKDIKNKYLLDPDVLEYCLYKILITDYYELPEPTTCKEYLDEYKEYVDPVLAFWNELKGRFEWDLLPLHFLYDLFVEWYRRTSGGDRNCKGQRSFFEDIKTIIAKDPNWMFSKKIRTCQRMEKPEPLILEYDLKRWMNPMYISSNEQDKKCSPLSLEYYRGFYRRYAVQT